MLGPHNRFRPSIVVAIPVKDEADRIGSCLRALADQKGVNAHQVAIVLLLNNCTDETVKAIDKLTPNLPVRVYPFEVRLPQQHATAGYARRLAMEAAEEMVDPEGVLLTTDADGQVDRNWIALNLQALLRGADAVAGRIDIDPVEASLIPPKLHQDDARECIYSELLDRISAQLDPDPFDPLPRHSEHAGASIAVTVSAFRRAGSIPAIALGEDRAFFAALRRVDARIRHAPEVRVVVSGRTIGRAVGGMADTIRRRMVRPDEKLDDRLEPAIDAARRAQLRNLARLAWSRPGLIERMSDFFAKLLLMLPDEVARVLNFPYFGAAWAELESRSISLLKRKVLIADLQNQTNQARAILDLCARGRRINLVPSTCPTDAIMYDRLRGG
jgi:glycosyltransferase involved in cell wall biosynthesis